jgi:hypothetical protein
LCKCTVYDRKFGGFLAKNTIYVHCTYMVLANLRCVGLGVNRPCKSGRVQVSCNVCTQYDVHTWPLAVLHAYVHTWPLAVLHVYVMMCTHGHWQYCMYAVYYMHYQSYHATSAVLPAHVLYYQCSLTSATILPVHVLPELPCYQCSATSACTVLPVQPY